MSDQEKRMKIAVITVGTLMFTLAAVVIVTIGALA